MKFRSKTAVVTGCIFLYIFILPAVGFIVWSDNHHDKCGIPEPDADFTAVADDDSYSPGLKTDDSIVTRDPDDYASACYHSMDSSSDFKDSTAGTSVTIYYGGCSSSPKSDGN